jgi:hypothetical protein
LSEAIAQAFPRFAGDLVWRVEAEKVQWQRKASTY